jgi:hypothetical protein
MTLSKLSIPGNRVAWLSVFPAPKAGRSVFAGSSYLVKPLVAGRGYVEGCHVRRRSSASDGLIPSSRDGAKFELVGLAYTDEPGVYGT